MRRFASSLIALSLASALAFALVGAAGCRKKPPAAPPPPADELSRFALKVVEAARSPAGLGPDLVDDDLVERVRCMQLVKRTLMDTWDPDTLLKAFHGEAGPDRQYVPAERPQKQRERATRGLRATLEGTCSAKPWTEGLKQRVEYLVTEANAKFPEEILAGQKELAARLANAELARVTCTHGDIGFVVVKARDGTRRLVDAFNLVRATMEIHPNEPTMK